MKRKLLFGAFAALLCFVTACTDTNNGGGNGDGKSYILSKIIEVDNGESLDYLEVKYASTNPVVISELTIFHWGDESLMGPKRKMPVTKASVINDKTILKNIVKTANSMTFDIQMLESDGLTEDYGSYDIALNGQGYATTIKFTSKMTGVENLTSTVAYTADGYMSKFDMVSVEERETFEFTYSGGNMTKLSDTYTYNEEGQQDTETYEMTFTDYQTENKGGIMHPALSNSDGMFDIFFSLGILGKPAKMLPSKGDWGDNDIDTYTYEKGSNGCISKFTLVNTYMDGGKPQSHTDIWAYEYIEVAAKK